MQGRAKYRCPVCSYSTNNSVHMDKHKRALKHDGNKRRVSKVGTVTYGRGAKK